MKMKRLDRVPADHLQYGDEGAGLDNDFIQRNVTIMTWNLMHVAKMLRDAGGLPNHGNDRNA